MDMGNVMEVLGTAERIEHLAAIREKRLHRIPNPTDAISGKDKNQFSVQAGRNFFIHLPDLVR